MFKGMSKAQLGACFVIAVVSVVGSKEALPPFYLGDAIAMVLIGAMAWWLLSVRGDKPTGHDEPHQSVFFRLGKALNGVRRGLRRSA